MLLELNPSLARYSTFGGLNSPLHFAAAKGHNEVPDLPEFPPSRCFLPELPRQFDRHPLIGCRFGAQIVLLLLKNGACVDSRNYCGQVIAD